MNKIHMKIVSLVILTVLLSILTVGLIIAVANTRQEDTGFSGTFVQQERLLIGHLH